MTQQSKVKTAGTWNSRGKIYAQRFLESKILEFVKVLESSKAISETLEALFN